MSSPPKALANTPATSNRPAREYLLRTKNAAEDALESAPPQVPNNDEARYADKCGTYSKGIQQAGIGLVDLAAFHTFKTALNSGKPADFENIILGGPGTLNGPQGGLAFDLECLDSSQFSVPPAPELASEAYATELIELYWASLLRDVAFTDYASDPIAAQAASELSSLPAYAGPRDGSGNVTAAQYLFRGGSGNLFPGETVGPYVSQFLLKNTCMGALSIDQRYTTFKAGVDYMTDPTTFLQVQNGVATGAQLQTGPAQYLHNGRGLAAYAHNDVLYQAYFTAFLVLRTLLGVQPAVQDNSSPLNPGNPYLNWTKQNGFNTFGPPDFISTLGAVASEALKAVWFQKWYVHLRHRPEAGGGIVYLDKTNQSNKVQGRLSPTVLNSKAVQKAFSTNNSYFLSQAFPEGSPRHPAYPTGHGTVAGACITVLKFFFDGDAKITNPVAPSRDGMSLNSYTGADAAQLTVNGELHKLAHNISFGHGIHGGIHWRSDTDTSIELGEAVALSVLRNRADTYNEKFTVELSKVDGTKTTISN
jgi:hypothetical protein